MPMVDEIVDEILVAQGGSSHMANVGSRRGARPDQGPCSSRVESGVLCSTVLLAVSDPTDKCVSKGKLER